jgi:uncharacterized protein (DUF58 family)
MQVRPAFWGIFIVFLVGLTGYALTGARIYSRVLSLSGILIAVSFVWTYISLRGVTLTRTARFLRQQVGQVFEERFEINNQYPVTKLWLDIRDQSNLPGRSGSKLMTLIGARQRRSYVAYTRLTHRGQFHLGPTQVSSGDPFGLFRNVMTLPGERSLLVLPHMADLERVMTPPGVLPGGRALRRRTLEVTPYAAGVREYASGDALNRIHWPTTARKDRLMVKEFDQDPMADLWIFLDANDGVQLSVPDESAQAEEITERHWLWRQQQRVEFPNHTFEYAVSAAASIAGYFMRVGRAVGMASAGQVFTAITAERSERQLGKILETLAYLQPEGELPMIGLIQAQSPHLPRGSTVIVITPSLDKNIEVGVEEMIRRDLQPMVVLLDRASFGGRRQSDEMVARLRSRRVPVAVIRRGDDIRTTIEAGF